MLLQWNFNCWLYKFSEDLQRVQVDTDVILDH